MADNTTKITLTEPQRLWLSVICSKLRSGESVSARGLKVELRDRLPRDFNPSEIDSRLLRHEDKITLLGIGLLDPDSEAVKKADTVILSVRELLASNHDIKSVGVDYVSEDTKLTQVEVACAFKDLSEIGVFHDSGTTYGYGVDGWATINTDERAFDGFLKYENIEQILDTIVEGRGATKILPAGGKSDEAETWDFFIAHAGKDKLPAQQLYRLLAPHSRVFLDSECLLPGDEWDWELALAQRNSRITLVLISSNVGDAYYAREEIASAVAMAREDKQRHRVVPIFLDAAGSDVPYGLRLKHGYTVSSELSLETISEKLLVLLTRLPRTPRASISLQNGARSLSKEKGVVNGAYAGTEANLRWTPEAIRNMTLISTGCLGLLVLIVGSMFGMLTGRIPVNALGGIQGISVVVCLISLGLILYWIVKIPFLGDRRNESAR